MLVLRIDLQESRAPVIRERYHYRVFNMLFRGCPFDPCRANCRPIEA